MARNETNVRHSGREVLSASSTFAQREARLPLTCLPFGQTTVEILGSPVFHRHQTRSAC